MSSSDSREGRLRAWRKDPLRRAQRAPAKKVTPVPCPLGKCDHVAGLHEPAQAGYDGFGAPLQGAHCLARDCGCEGALE